MEWQEEYLAELKRTTGRTGHIESRRGGWYWLVVKGQEEFAQPHRKSDIVAMTGRLKERPSCEP